MKQKAVTIKELLRPLGTVFFSGTSSHNIENRFGFAWEVLVYWWYHSINDKSTISVGHTPHKPGKSP